MTSVQIRSFFWSVLPAVFNPNAGKYGPEKTPYLDTFHALDLIKLMSKNSDDHNENYVKIKFNSVDKLPLNKMREIPSMIIVVRVVFYEDKKYYPQVFLDE